MTSRTSNTDALESAFILHEQQFCVRTTSIREIRGWGIGHATNRMLADGAILVLVAEQPTIRCAQFLVDVAGLAAPADSRLNGCQPIVGRWEVGAVQALS
ncbi:hypothetical protein C7449_11142 [Mycoplana dimorpha]|uniref:Uncharacterized protein n=1 Tax=Mycoplana dimorpha TaxID=28320 RepID=A0A2T5AR05_MYCDI|nr:hypothetical protein C7449_11142 [Mycoplana dimorpha]